MTTTTAASNGNGNGRNRDEDKDWKLVLRVEHLIDQSGVRNPHQLAIKSGVSAPSIANWNQKPNELQILYLRTFLNVLTKGLGLSRQEILALRVGDLFDIIEDDNAGNHTNGKNKATRRKAAASKN